MFLVTQVLKIDIIVAKEQNYFFQLNRKVKIIWRTFDDGKLLGEVEREGGASVTHATGVMSRIMEQTAVAITSNGRTVYELAHMNIPSIVVPQHERERTHSFAREATGFVPMLSYQKGVSETKIQKKLERLLTDYEFRAQLMNNIGPYSFGSNKKEVLREILSLFKDV